MRFRAIGAIAVLVVLVGGLGLLGGRATEAQTLPLVDLVFIIDESGSMGDDQADVRDRVDEIVAGAAAQMDASFGLVGFGDDSTIRTLAEPGPAAAFGAALSRLVVGGDGERGVAATIHATTLPFRTGARPCFVLITDEGSFGGDLASARSALDAVGATWFGVALLGKDNTETVYGPAAGSLSAHTGGLVVSISTFRQDAGPVLNALVDRCAKASVRDPATRTVVSSVLDWNQNPVVGDQIEIRSSSGYVTFTEEGHFTIDVAATDSDLTAYHPNWMFDPYAGVLPLIPGVDSGYVFIASIRPTIDCLGGSVSEPPQTDLLNRTGESGLVFITHGWKHPLDSPSQDVGEFVSLREQIDEQAGDDWKVVFYDWTTLSNTGLNPRQAARNADHLGLCIGNIIAAEGYTDVHFIAHSAGARLIETATLNLRARRGQSVMIQETVLDPFALDYYAGSEADWSEQYLNTDDTTAVSTNKTDYVGMFNFDGTAYWEQYDGIPVIENILAGGHGAPIMHYLCSVARLNDPLISLELWSLGTPCTWRPDPAQVHAGFALARENPQWTTALWDSYPKGQVQVFRADGTVAGHSPLVHALTEANIDLSNVIVTKSPSGLGELTLNGAGGAPSIEVLNLSPAWLAADFELVQSATHLRFDYEFKSAVPAAGLLQVLVDGVPVLMADERYASGVTSSGTLPLHQPLAPGRHTIMVRLDPLNEGDSSIIEVSNIRFFVESSATQPDPDDGEGVEPEPSEQLAGPPPTVGVVVPLAPAFLGTVPTRGLPALLVTGREVLRDDLIVALKLDGCGPQTMAVLEAGRWSVYIEGAPSQVNAAFPESLADRTPFFIRC